MEGGKNTPTRFEFLRAPFTSWATKCLDFQKKHRHSKIWVPNIFGSKIFWTKISFLTQHFFGHQICWKTFALNSIVAQLILTYSLRELERINLTQHHPTFLYDVIHHADFFWRSSPLFGPEVWGSWHTYYL